LICPIEYQIDGGYIFIAECARTLKDPASLEDYKKHLWGIILAGGEGTRLQPYIEQIYGYPRPKQYCTLTGTRSLISHTKDRVLRFIPPEHLMTIVNSCHSRYISEEIENKIPGTLVIQPIPRETTAGILLPLLKVHHSDPDAVVSIFPSDQFINQEDRFMNYVEEANQFVKSNPDLIVMLGIHPDKPESGYGWIEPVNYFLFNKFSSIRKVRRFWEKPDNNKLRDLWSQGCLCNTFVLIGKCSTLINSIKKYAPDVYSAFNDIRNTIGTPLEKLTIEQTFRFVPEVNFSKCILEKITGSLCVLQVDGVYWSDWGEEHRVKTDIQRIKFTKETVIN
jgi:mannose-1-phosphate guanylyltransferase